VTVTEVVDSFHRLDPEFFALSEQSVATAPHPRVHVLRAAVARPFGLPVDPQAELAAANALGPAPIDASFLNSAQTFVAQGPAAAAPLFVEHCQAFPDDIEVGFLRTMALVMGGQPGGRDRAMALVEADVGRHGDNWRYLPGLAMVRQEQQRFEESRVLAEAALDQEPRAGHAVHTLTHVNYETGEHTEGLRWLDGWRSEHTVALYQEHFGWHATLHLLALGEVGSATDRYDAEVGPGAPIDAGTFLWRCHLAGSPNSQAGEAAVAAAQPLFDYLPFHFPVFNACFAMAAAGDVESLSALASRLEADPRPVFPDIVAPIVRALIAILESQPDEAVRILDAVMVDLPRVGGSNAQREVVEDTLLYAYVESGRHTEARRILEARLERRPHVLDSRLLARTI
jgi:hypothetical protein